jgi:hypothetical protein
MYCCLHYDNNNTGMCARFQYHQSYVQEEQQNNLAMSCLIIRPKDDKILLQPSGKAPVKCRALLSDFLWSSSVPTAHISDLDHRAST